MKKLILLIVLVCIAGIFAACYPQEKTSGNSLPLYRLSADVDREVYMSSDALEKFAKIESTVNQVESVEESVVLGYGDSLVVGVKTSGVFSAKQDKQLKSAIEESIKKNFPEYNNIFILTRVKDYYMLTGLKSKLDEGLSPMEVYEILLDMLRKDSKGPKMPRDPRCPINRPEENTTAP